MSESMRLLDRDLPRLTDIFTAEFKRRMEVRSHRAVPLLTLPPSPLAFAPKEPKTRHLIAHRRELARRAAAIDAQTASLTVDPIDQSKPAHAILVNVARQHGVSVSAVKGPCRARFLVAVRHQAIVRIYLAHHPRMSLPMIARAIGGRDHTTVLHAIRKAGVHRALDRRQA